MTADKNDKEIVPSRLSDGELILCLEEMRRRDANQSDGQEKAEQDNRE